MARILITGASSYLGKNIAITSQRAGHEVHIVTRQSTDTSLLPEDIAAANRHCHDGFMPSMLSILEAVNADVIFHTAGYYSRDSQLDEVERLVNSNLMFGTQILEALRRQSKPAQFLNTASTFQYYHSVTPRPLNLYAATKQAFECLLNYYGDIYNLRYLSLVIPDIYGPDDWRDKLVYLLMDSAKSSKALELPVEDIALNLLHVEDAAAAYLRAAELMLGGGGELTKAIYAVTPPESYKISEIIQLVAEVAGSPPTVAWGKFPLPANHVTTPWIGEILPGWQPKVSLRSGLDALANIGT